MVNTRHQVVQAVGRGKMPESTGPPLARPATAESHVKTIPCSCSGFLRISGRMKPRLASRHAPSGLDPRRSHGPAASRLSGLPAVTMWIGRGESRGGQSVARLLVIVSRKEPSRTTYLKHVFASETVDVMLDRRAEERRRFPLREQTAVERRRGDPRPPDITHDLQTYGSAVVKRLPR